jgi:hypothetical protein
MSDFAIEVTNVTGGTDNRWLRSSHALDTGLTGTLDLAAAAAVVDKRNADTGILPSGIAVGQITATGLYGLFDPTADDGREVLAGFVLADVKVIDSRFNVLKSGKVPFALLAHGTISRKFLPVEAQRTSITYLTASTGQFVYVD